MLTQGSKFSKNYPIEEIVSGIEPAFFKRDPDVSDVIHLEVLNVIKKVKPPSVLLRKLDPENSWYNTERVVNN